MILVAAAVVCAASLAPRARGDPQSPFPGTLDTSFGDGGISVTHSQCYALNAITVQPDGKFVVAGFSNEPTKPGADFAVARFNADGTLDATFGDGGVVLTDVTGSDSRDVASAVAVLSDGRILVAGMSNPREYPDGYDNDFALVCYLPDGSIDTSFGVGGRVLTDFGGESDGVRGLVLQSDSRIVVVGHAYVHANRNVAIARYNPDGSLDETFGAEGKVLADIGGDDDSADAITLQRDGYIVIAGRTPSSSERNDTDFAIARFRPDGSLDESFGSDGWVRTDFFGGGDGVTGLAIQDDGRIVAVGFAQRTSGESDPVVARYRPNGALDRSFSGNGKLHLQSPTPVDGAKAVLIQPDGRILVGCGMSGWSGRRDFSLARVNPKGWLDQTFGDGGWATTDFSGREDWLTALAIAPEGQIIAAGTTFLPGEGIDFALACYTNDLETAPRIAVGVMLYTTLYVSGENFGDGAWILVNGRRVETGNDRSHPAEILFAPHMNDAIAPGETVTLRVQNRNGRLSNEFSYTRPAG
jgi:uncharacterized delta-60 repeat protein